MTIYDNSLYKDDIKYVADIDLPWNKMQNKSILISGSTGMIGSFFIDVLMYKNQMNSLCCKIYALGRNEKKARDRFGTFFDSEWFEFVEYDVNTPLNIKIEHIDYVLHLASNTHPMQYSVDPIGTITGNIIGAKNMLDFAFLHSASRCLLASSNEIYGENRGDTELFDEKYCGYIDSNTLRAGYPEAKRCSEALCQAYIAQENLDIVIARITRSYGPTLLESDTKALSQFLHRGILGENIVLKSSGTQLYSYLYVADTVSGLFTILLKGETGEAYNISDEKSDIMLKDLASIVAEQSGSNVVFEIPDAVEERGYSKATKARLSNKKITELGWSAKFDIYEGISRTMTMLKK